MRRPCGQCGVYAYNLSLGKFTGTIRCSSSLSAAISMPPSRMDVMHVTPEAMLASCSPDMCEELDMASTAIHPVCFSYSCSKVNTDKAVTEEKERKVPITTNISRHRCLRNFVPAGF